MRILAAMGIFKEVHQDTYLPTTLAGMYVTGSPFTAGVIHMSVNSIIAFRNHTADNFTPEPHISTSSPAFLAISRRTASKPPVMRSMARSNMPREPNSTILIGSYQIQRNKMLSMLRWAYLA